MFNMRHVLLSQRIKHFLFFQSSIGQIIQFYQSKVKNLTFPIMSFLTHSALLKANKHTYCAKIQYLKSWEIMGKKQEVICKPRRNTASCVQWPLPDCNQCSCDSGAAVPRVNEFRNRQQLLPMGISAPRRAKAVNMKFTVFQPESSECSAGLDSNVENTTLSLLILFPREKAEPHPWVLSLGPWTGTQVRTLTRTHTHRHRQASTHQSPVLVYTWPTLKLMKLSFRVRHQHGPLPGPGS